ncbi:fatty acid--CoA ligase family protein [Nesterenkonia sp. CL21]|uniref:class I adenylate-forming enzyme family protein n=1 Tax=Nesterenkonia sp. CL21 TaxID=3064894 RepID=UPI002879FBB6|nr:fatty acid--CoA ligase family protein [Nesterenkonia sp. CL21]MDS2173150.1 fatty acid--CoA ligase family protein [Nesterenkonia sp. CL21]
MSPADESPTLRPLRGPDHRRVLSDALAARAAGEVPLIGDERWSQEHWQTLLRSVLGPPLPEDAAWASFTSGSTGRPRAIVRSARSWEVSFPTVDVSLGIQDDDAVLIPVHPVSSMATYAVAHAHHRGLPWSTPVGARLRAADLDGPTILHGTPVHLQETVELLESGAPTTLRAAFTGGARLDVGLAARARSLGLQVVTYVGAAELSLVAVDTGDGLRPIPEVEVEVRADTLWVRSEQTALAVLGEGGSFRRDGSWATVGDRAALSSEGVLSLQGRADDAILTGGATVVPADVEAWLESLPGVRAALVLGEPHPRLGQLVTACVEPTQDTALDARVLTAAARTGLSPAQRPRKWRLVAELPRTASGKVRRLGSEVAFTLPLAAPAAVTEAATEAAR